MTWLDRQPLWVELLFVFVALAVATLVLWIAYDGVDLLGSALIFCGAAVGLTLRRRRLSKARRLRAKPGP
jgi:hypothetical protein